MIKKGELLKEKLEYEDDLKRNGLKTTKSRKSIIDILIQSNQPIAAEQIYFELKEKKIEMNLSTVYRTLETLEDIGLVSKIIIMDDDRMLFEYNKMEHRHYLICINCKKIVTIPGCPLKSYEKELENETKFTIVRHNLYLYGYCFDCQRKNEV